MIVETLGSEIIHRITVPSFNGIPMMTLDRHVGRGGISPGSRPTHAAWETFIKYGKLPPLSAPPCEVTPKFDDSPQRE